MSCMDLLIASSRTSVKAVIKSNDLLFERKRWEVASFCDIIKIIYFWQLGIQKTVKIIRIIFCKFVRKENIMAHSAWILFFVLLWRCNFNDAFSTTTQMTEQEIEEYDEKLSTFIQEVLENFRDQMREGIPDIGIPPIDPLAIPNIEENIDNVAKLELRMKHIKITGISKFEIKLLKADLEKGFANFSISLPELRADGTCYMNGKILGIFPISGDGPFFIQVNEVQMNGYGELNVTAGSESRIHMNDLKLNLTFGPLKLEFESLLGGTRWSQTLIKLLTGLGPNIFLHFHQEAMGELDKALLKLINSELDKGTLAELLEMINLAVPKSSDAF